MMIDRKDMNYVPNLEDLSGFIRNPLFDELCTKLETVYKAKYTIDFSKCSWEYGWNMKFKKSGKTLCTVYPRENYFTALVVVGTKEKEAVEQILPELSSEIQNVYHQTKEGNGQRWLMIDLEDEGEIYEDVLRLIEARVRCK